MDINAMTPATGRMVDEDGTVVNVVDLLNIGRLPPVSDKTVDINAYVPRTGRVIGEDGKNYNLVDIFKALIAGGGGVGRDEMVAYVDSVLIGIVGGEY